MLLPVGGLQSAAVDSGKLEDIVHPMSETPAVTGILSGISYVSGIDYCAHDLAAQPHTPMRRPMHE